jgi:hypothetical protein
MPARPRLHTFDDALSSDRLTFLPGSEIDKPADAH